MAIAEGADLRKVLRGYPQARVLVVGDVMLDRFVYGSVHRISPEAPIPIVKVRRELEAMGGAANVARNVVALGARCELIGVVGADEAGAALQRKVLDCKRLSCVLISDDSRPTTVKWRYVAETQQLLRADWESDEPLSDAVAERVLGFVGEALKRVDVVVLSDYAKGVLTESLTARIISMSRAAGLLVVVDPKSKDFAKYRGADVLTPNRSELQLASGEDCAADMQVEWVARRFIESGVCRQMIVTRGADGMTVVSASEPANNLRTVAQEVFDVSGAGDTVVAAVAAGLASGSGVVESAALANIAAGIVVGKRGTAEVTERELVEYLDAAARRGVSAASIVDEVQQAVREWKRLGLRVAFTNGCFDLLHPGHLALLEEARRAGDRLVVGLNSDASVKRLKGQTRPVQNEAARACVLSGLRCVDAVVVFEEDTPLALIHALVPDVLVKGADYSIETVVGAEFVRSYGGVVKLVELVPAQSTSHTIDRISRTRSEKPS